MAKRATITVKVDSTLKFEVEPIFQELGLTTTEALDTFYEAEQGINLVVCEDADDLFKKLGI